MGGRTSDWKGELERFLKPSSTSAARARHSLDTCRSDADQGQMAHHQLADRHERKAEGAFCRQRHRVERQGRVVMGGANCAVKLPCPACEIRQFHREVRYDVG
jgi:hypothetical protein